MNDPSDANLIHDAANGDVEAFCTIVKRYQTLVCSVAYGILGDVVTSEDIGQETFLSAWKQLSSLKDLTKLKSWLATIARNHARMHARKPSHQAIDQTTSEPTSTDKGIEEMVDRDELHVVWATLQRLPELYREPLILYYRQEQSVAEVAEALELSTDAVKQRLARGREMLRSQVMSTIECTLRKSRPTTAFTVAVMATIGASNTAAAATVGTGTISGAKLLAAKTIGLGTAGAIFGTLLGLAGGFMGVGMAWLFAHYDSQRKLIVRQCICYFVVAVIFSLPFVAMQLGWHPVTKWGATGYALTLVSWQGAFLLFNLMWIFWSIRSHQKLQLKEQSAGASRLPLRLRAASCCPRWEGRRWSSKAGLLGWPLIDIAFADPFVDPDPKAPMGRTARGWIAIGDRAFGRVLAIGNIAIAPFALGTFACGAVSCGVMSCGGLSVGILTLALISAGVVSVGGFSAGVVAMGVASVGVVALAAYASKGVIALSAIYSQGHVAIGAEANTEVSLRYFESCGYFASVEEVLFSIASAQVATLITVLIGIVLTGSFFVAYRRSPSANP